MPEPLHLLLLGVLLLLLIALVSVHRLVRLRQHIDESARALAAQRQERDRLVGTPPVAGTPADGRALAEQIAEAEDRLAAVHRLHAAQVRTWNRLGARAPWRQLRRLARWRPPPDTAAGASAAQDRP